MKDQVRMKTHQINIDIMLEEDLLKQMIQPEIILVDQSIDQTQLQGPALGIIIHRGQIIVVLDHIPVQIIVLVQQDQVQTALEATHQEVVN